MDRHQARFEELVQAVDDRIEAVEKSTVPGFRQQVGEIVNDLLELYSIGLERVMLLVQNAPCIPEALAEDPIIRQLLILHNIHPLSFRERVSRALDSVRPYLKSHGGSVRLESTEHGIVHLKLEGHCDGCPSSRFTVESAIQQELMQWAPDMADCVVEGEIIESPHNSGQVIIPLAQVRGFESSMPSSRTGWVSVEDIPQMRPNTARTMRVGERPMIVVRSGDDFYAYHNYCSACRTLEKIDYTHGILRCSHCLSEYSLRQAGQSLSGASFHLEPIPLLVMENQARLALPTMEY